jgi:hypothetical protein
MKWKTERPASEGVGPRESKTINEIDKTRASSPKTYVPYNERRTMGDPNPPAPLYPTRASKKRKSVQPTLPKAFNPEDWE